MEKPMDISTARTHSRSTRHDACNDPVIGAILSGWRYDISGISPVMRVDYEEHLSGCSHCRRRQHLHRTVDVLLISVTTLAFTAFLLAALVMRRLEALTHINNVHLRLHENPAVTHIPSTIAISLQAVAISGVVISMLLWVLVAIVTPVPAIVTGFVRERVFKHAA